MENYVFIDSVIFFISNIILVIYVIKNKELSRKEKIAYSIFFIILNSSFNIMMKKIHDFNICIPRNFIYRYKIIGPLSPLDIICGLIIIFNLKYMLRTIMNNKIILLQFLRSFGLYLIGTISFFVFSGYWMDNGNKFLTTSKGWLYSLATLIITFKYMNKNVNLIVPFAIILINGWISTFCIPADAIWTRYGHRVSILDQEDAYTISICLITLLMVRVLLIKSLPRKKKVLNYAVLAIFLLQNIYCMYKTNFIVLPLIFLVYCIVTNGKNVILTSATLLGIPTIIIVLWDKIYNMITSLAMQTRSSQIADLLNYIKEYGIYPYILGIGISTPYYSTTETNDLGERKIIDLQTNEYSSNWRTDIQTPIVSIFKESGAIGLTYFIVITAYITLYGLNMIKKIIKNVKEKDYTYTETVALGIFMFVATSYGQIFYGGSIPYPIFYAFCLGKFTINFKKLIKQSEREE